jgi:LPS sulfotransferase NodH
VLEQFISFKTAALSRVWHHIDCDPTQRPAGLKFHFDKAEFERFHARCQRLHHELQTQLQRHHRPYLEISYETLTRTPDPEARILAFLGAAPAPLATSKTRKINTAPMETYVENWPDVGAALSGTPYEHYLGQ